MKHKRRQWSIRALMLVALILAILCAMAALWDGRPLMW